MCPIMVEWFRVLDLEREIATGSEGRRCLMREGGKGARASSWMLVMGGGGGLPENGNGSFVAGRFSPLLLS